MIAETDRLIELPKGWVWSTLGEIRVEHRQSISPKTQPNQAFELYSVPSFQNQTPEVVLGKQVGSSKQIVSPDTVLLCKINPRINRVWVVGDCTGYPKIASTEWIPFGKSCSLFPKYLCYFMRNDRFRDFLAANVSGVGGSLMRVKASTFAEYPFPLPPLAEQHRIVVKIEELFTKLDAGVEALKKVRQELKRYRQAVLKHAFEGGFTDEQVIPGEWPKDWAIVKLGDVSEMCLGKMLDKKKNRGEYEPYLRNLNVRWGYFDLGDLLQMRFEEHEQSRYGLSKGDLVICEGGEPGRAAIWNDEKPNMKIQKALHRIRLAHDVYNKFLLYFLMLSSQDGYLKRYFTGTTIKHLPGEKLKTLEFPLPNSEKQRATVEEIERHFSIADQIEQTVEQGLKQSNRLRQSILKKAFKGKLVPQDLEDEPAEKLLERIRVEKAKLQAKHKDKKKTATIPRKNK